jgi:hypothetical protein
MESPPATISDWLEYSSVGGRELGLSLREYETSLRIDLKSNLAFLESHQPTSDRGGEPLGTSRAVVPLALARQLREVLSATDLASVPKSQRNSSGRSAIRLTRTTDGTKVEALFAKRDLDAQSALAPLMQTLDDIVAFVAETPFQAIRLSIELIATPGGASFAVKVTNVGSQPVMVPDLAALARAPSEHPEHWFGVRVAEYPEPPPGYTPPPFNWLRLELLPLSPGVGPQRLEPTDVLTFRTAAMKRVAPGIRHLVQAVFSSYSGEAVLDGHLVIRGRALSTALRWVPDGVTARRADGI